jgi:hypothetical protein
VKFKVKAKGASDTVEKRKFMTHRESNPGHPARKRSKIDSHIETLAEFRVLFQYLCVRGRRDSVVCIANGYGLDDRETGVRVPLGSRIFASTRRPDCLWGPPSLLCNA